MEWSNPHPLCLKGSTSPSPVWGAVPAGSLIPSHPVSFENIVPLILSPLLYFHLVPFQYKLHNLYSTIYLGDNVFAAQAPVFTGPFLFAYKDTCFPLNHIKKKKKILNPTFSLSFSLNPLLPFTAKLLKRVFKICCLHLLLYFSPLTSGRHPSPPLYSNCSVNGQLVYILSNPRASFNVHQLLHPSLHCDSRWEWLVFSFLKISDSSALGILSKSIFHHCLDWSFAGSFFSDQFLNLDILNSFFFFFFFCLGQTMVATMGQIGPVACFLNKMY